MRCRLLLGGNRLIHWMITLHSRKKQLTPLYTVISMSFKLSLYSWINAWDDDIQFMNSQLVGTNICIDIWKVLSNRPSVLPTKRHPIITWIIQISFPSDKIHLWNLQKFRSSPTSGKPGLFDNSNAGQFRKKCPQKLRMSEWSELSLPTAQYRKPILSCGYF